MTIDFRHKRSNIPYPCTNETIEAVLAGLKPSASDVIVCSGGSGDVAFAIAPFVKKVFAVDMNPYQIEYMKNQKSLLEQGNFGEFLKVESPYSCYHDIDLFAPSRRSNYFSQRFENVRSSLSKVEIVHDDIFHFMQSGGSLGCPFFDNLYLSNILRYAGVPLNSETLVRSLVGLSVGGGVYTAIKSVDSQDKILPHGLELDLDRTREVLTFEKSEFLWRPMVYRKVGEVVLNEGRNT